MTHWTGIIFINPPRRTTIMTQTLTKLALNKVIIGYIHGFMTDHALFRFQISCGLEDFTQIFLKFLFFFF